MEKSTVKDYLLGLQDSLCQAFSGIDGGAFREDNWQRPDVWSLPQ